jgi:hypothetical protein
VRTLAKILLGFLLLSLVACGGGTRPSSPTSGPLSGNWQLKMTQFPHSTVPLLASGFLLESNNALTGSVQGPTVLNSDGSVTTCGGVGALTGSISGQNITFSLDPGGTVLNFTGSISSSNTSMSGQYQALGGPCFASSTTGTWKATLVPPLNGNFTGTLSSSQYMAALTGLPDPPPIIVSGTLAQSPNIGANNASLTGTITAQGYPCFVTASLTGTISGDAVLLSVYGFNGDLIGSIGLQSPATVTTGASGTSLNTDVSGLLIGSSASGHLTGPCPLIETSSGTPISFDTAAVSLTF